MSIKFFVQWYQWVLVEKFNWVDFDIINISFERDKVAMNWNATVVLLGFGFCINYVSKHSQEVWEEVMKERYGA